MRMLFIFPDLSSTVTHDTGAPSCGLAGLAAVRRDAGHTRSGAASPARQGTGR